MITAPASPFNLTSRTTFLYDCLLLPSLSFPLNTTLPPIHFLINISLSSRQQDLLHFGKMEQNLPVLAKKVSRLGRVVYLMLRKGVSKRKLLLDLNMMMKRGKIAGKALHNLMFHHHKWAAFASNRRSHDSHHLSFSTPPPGEYEFSCSNSPASSNYPPENLDMMAVNAAVLKAMEMVHSETASPALPGFGRSPMVRQLRITDSPFPLSSVDDDSHVDEAAEQFISRFYSDLRRQNTKGSFGSPS